MPYTETANKHYKKPALGTLPADWPEYITGDLDAIDADIHALEVAGQEVIGARGGEASLDARLDAIDTSISTALAGASEVVAARGGQANLDARLDGLDSSIAAASASVAEVTAARGSKSSLDQRLDIALNEDGTLKSDAYPEVVTARGTKSTLNDRMSVSLNDDGTLKATATVNLSSWVLPSFAFIYLTSQTFKVVGDQTDIYKATRRLKATLTAGSVYSEVVSAAFSSGYTTITIANAVLDNTLTTVEHSILLPASDAADGGKSALSPRMLGQSATDYAADTGAANAYVVTLNPAPTAYFAGMKVRFKAGYGNTGESTINVNGLGVKTIKKQATFPLQINDIVAGQIVEVVYDGVSNFQQVNAGQSQRTSVLPATFVELAVKTWAVHSAASADQWYSIAWSPELGLFAAVANVGGSNTVMTSPDGKNWTLRAAASSELWYSITWSSARGIFAAVAATGSGNRVMTSPDGITWTPQTSAADNLWKSIVWSPELGLFAAVARTGTNNRVMTSPDGIAWTIRTSAADNQWNSIAWSPALGLFAAVAITGTGNRVMTSPDGIAWTIRTSPADNNWQAIAWSPEQGLFAAVADSGTSNRVMTSPDGISWTLQTSAADNMWKSIAWSPELGLFAAVAATGTGNRVMTSPDGISWTLRTSASDNQWFSIAWSPQLGMFASVANTGGGVMISTGTSENKPTVNAAFNVVQNPANATATPTANKIVMAGSNGKVDKGWLFGFALVSGSNVTTTGQTLVDITGLSIALEANSTYEFEAMLSCNVSAVTTGNKYGVQFSAAGASVEGGIIGKAATGVGNDRISALNTAYGAYLTEASVAGPILMKGIITTGANAGNLTIQHMKVTSGTSTVYIGSFLKTMKIA